MCPAPMVPKSGIVYLRKKQKNHLRKIAQRARIPGIAGNLTMPNPKGRFSGIVF